jgi:hypothetical protein
MQSWLSSSTRCARKLRAKEYGMAIDYMDPNTGNIYRLTDAIDDGEGGLLVPVTAPYGDSILLGYAKMQKPE